MSLSESVKNLELGKNGLEIRSALITLLTELLTDTDNSSGDLSGYKPRDFLFNKILDDIYGRGSLEGFYTEYSEKLKNTTVEDVDGTIADKIDSIADTKHAIASLVNQLYGETRIIIDSDPSTGIEDTPFSDYANIIAGLGDGGMPVYVTSPVAISENGEYVAETGNAYNPVVVAVPVPTLTTRVITGNDANNATYYASQDNGDAYEWVQVSISGDAPSFTVRFMNEDGSQILQTCMNVPLHGYANFTGAYPTSSDNTKTFVGWNPSPNDVTEDRDCYPQFDVVSTSYSEIQDSWETIVQNRGANYPIGSYKTFTVPAGLIVDRYFNDSFDPDSINNGTGSQNCFLDPVQYSTQLTFTAVKAFSGEAGSTSTWLVDGYKVTGNAGYSYKNVPVGSKFSEVNAYSSSGGLLLGRAMFNDDRHNLPCRYPVHPLPSYSQGWGPQPNQAEFNTYLNDSNVGGSSRFRRFIRYYGSYSGGVFGWENSDLRRWLNETFINYLPEEIRNAIVSVTKHSRAVNTKELVFVPDQITRDKLWIPSAAEITGCNTRKVWWAGWQQGNLNPADFANPANANYSEVIFAPGAGTSSYDYLRGADGQNTNGIFFNCYNMGQYIVMRDVASFFPVLRVSTAQLDDGFPTINNIPTFVSFFVRRPKSGSTWLNKIYFAADSPAGNYSITESNRNEGYYGTDGHMHTRVPLLFGFCL